MKSIIFFIACLLSIQLSFAQQVIAERQVIGATGSNVSTATLQVSSNVGEAVITTSGYAQNSLVMTHGFEQPSALLYLSAITGDSSLCLGETTTLTDSVANGKWTSSNPNIASIDSISGVLATLQAGTTIIHYTLNDISVSTVITVHSLPIANAGSNKSICFGGSTLLNASGGNSYLWSNGDTNPSVMVSQAGTYYVVAYNSFGCADTSSTVSVAIKTMPTTVKIKVVGLTSVCEPATIPFQLDMPYGSTTGFDYQWKLGGTPISGATDSVYNATSSGMYSLTVSGGVACFKNAAGKTVTVKSLPNASFTAGGPTTFCQGQSVTFNAPTITGYTYTWLNNGVSAGSGMTKIFKVAGNITLIAKLAGCADTTTTPVTIVVNPLPIATVSSDPNTPTTFCAGSSCNLWASPTGASNYHWINGTFTADLPTYINNVSTAGAWKVIVTDNNGCVSKTSSGVTTKVNTVPVAGITITGATSQIAFAANSYIKLNATPSTGVTWQWYLNGNTISGATLKSFNATQAGEYTVACTKLSCIGTSIAINLTKASSKDVDGTTNNSGESLFELTAYPNPVRDVLTVTISGKGQHTEGRVEVIDALGKLVASYQLPVVSNTNQTTDHYQLKTENWTSGIYFIHYKDDKERTGTVKVVKE